MPKLRKLTFPRDVRFLLLAVARPLRWSLLLLGTSDVRTLGKSALECTSYFSLVAAKSRFMLDSV